MSAGTTATWIRPTYDGPRVCDYSCVSFRCRSPFFGGGAVQSNWSQTRPQHSLSKIRVAADYSDSLPHSYHPLEEKGREKDKDLQLTDAEIARTTVEANRKALLVFPGRVHREPHGHVSWAEFQYVIDDYGDIFFEFLEEENILQDHAASNPVTVLIGMDTPLYVESRTLPSNYMDNLNRDDPDDIQLDDDYDVVCDTTVMDTLIKWGMPDTLRQIHPIYFAKCLTKSVHNKYWEIMEHPSNGLSIVGYLRPAFVDEESYLRRLFHHENSDGYMSDWKDESEKEVEEVTGAYNLIDGELLNFSSKGEGGNVSTTLYKLEIMTMQLFSVYGDQTMVSLEDFQDAEPDVLAHSASAIIERFGDYGTQCNTALRALCQKKKGLAVDEASLIGVDSLGMDVRVSSGMEARTLRFSFNARVMSESAAEKKIKQMLFPRYHRKSSKATGDGSGTQVPSKSLDRF